MFSLLNILKVIVGIIIVLNLINLIIWLLKIITLKLRTRILLWKYFSEKDNDLDKRCFWLMIKVLGTKILYKKHKYFIHAVADYKKRKGICTQVQLDALNRIVKNG